ncbi:Lrp/AsnC family transcriptional regulator [Evansella clarkii]|jgi:Lrp/AsnC family leucine-responsive transcriptional regulator|uniref:Lrp/AsnC family transcriptional regulator n=1 Tax=Evansella clarkii TaxID=79879 RepID=UPI00099754BB|nr:Lrp/AsnC family transcriptional regulator [Evansella clarkii]
MDNTDIRLLEILQEDGRITLSDLSKELALSRPSVTERLTRLKEQGIINRIGARVSPESVGRKVLLFIQVSDVTVPYNEFEEMISRHPDIIECHRVTGMINYLLKAAVDDMDHLGKLIDHLIPYAAINTSIVLSSPVEEKVILPSPKTAENPEKNLSRKTRGELKKLNNM